MGENILLMPCATGLSLNFCFNFLRQRSGKSKKIILWFRIDQGSCLKSMLLGDFEVKIIQLSKNSITLQSEILDLEKSIEQNEDILCVHATSSCFAPREPDNIVKIAEVCQKHKIPLVVNNAYGIQSSKSVNLIETAMNLWKPIDKLPFLVVQSMDKNFMVPV